MYDIIVADPPWYYRNRQNNDPARGGVIYPVLTDKELMRLPIYKLANTNALLFLWTTAPKLAEGIATAVCSAWGFVPVTIAFVWVKTTKNGATIVDNTNLEEYDSYHSGLGYYTNTNVEFVLLGRRGKALTRAVKNIKQLIFAPVRSHSEKPKEFYLRIDSLYPNYQKIELFARKQNPPPDGWRATGLEFDGLRIEEFLSWTE